MERTMGRVFNTVMEALDKEDQVCAYDVAKKRQIQLLEESQVLTAEHNELMQRLAEIDQRRKEVNIEYKLIEAGLTLESRTVYTEQTITIHTQSGQRIRGDRMSFEQVLNKIFDVAGRPLSMAEIIKELEKFDYTWNSYQSAYNYIRNCSMLESTGARGYYQLLRVF